ncbi:OmpP1/FadL family transporter [Tistrella bauzanensis]
MPRPAPTPPIPRPAPTLRTTPGTASLTAATATAIVMILAAGPVSAAGFFIQEQSVQGVGRAFAGDVALGEDASTIFTNPAGMTRLKGRQAQLGGHYLILRATLTDTGSSATTLGSGGASVPLGGGDGGNPFDDTPCRTCTRRHRWMTKAGCGWASAYRPLRSGRRLSGRLVRAL